MTGFCQEQRSIEGVCRAEGLASLLAWVQLSNDCLSTGNSTSQQRRQHVRMDRFQMADDPLNGSGLSTTNPTTTATITEERPEQPPRIWLVDAGTVV